MQMVSNPNGAFPQQHSNGNAALLTQELEELCADDHFPSFPQDTVYKNGGVERTS